MIKGAIYIYTKYTNYCSRNYLAPLQIKFKVLTSCVTSTIIYGCETWGKSIPKDSGKVNTKRNRAGVQDSNKTSFINAIQHQQ